MALLALLERLVAVIIFIILFTQIVLPPFIGKRFFWAFRSSEKKISSKVNELSELNDEEKVVDLDTEIKEKKKKLNEKMTQREE